MGLAQPLFLLLGSFLSYSAAYDVCGTHIWNPKLLRSHCSTPFNPAYRSPACSVARLCWKTGSGTGTELCKLQRLYTTLCSDQPDLLECDAFRQLFTSSAADYAECVDRMTLGFGSTSALEGFMAEACAPGSRLGVCDRCNAGACDTPDPLLAYTAVCSEISAPGCAPWVAFCERETGPVAKALCSQRRDSTAAATAAAAVTSSGSGPHGSSGRIAAAGSSAGGQAPPPPPADFCVQDPTQPVCENYRYPDSAAQADINRLCDSMPDMPGCAIQRACEKGDGSVAVGYCYPFAVLATLCHDMPGMRGCESYKALCNKPGSVVLQCTQEAAVPGVPTWSQARKAVFTACEDHPMEGCATCSRINCPDPLGSLANICHEMPSMEVCGVFWNFCDLAGGAEDVAEWCAEDDSKYLPSMLMYFHQRTQELLLWKEWRPRTQGQYLVSVAVIVAMGVITTGLKTAKGALVLRWNHDRAVSGSQPARVTSVWLPAQGQMGEILAKSAITGVSLTLDYFNMLIAMTFNVGFFCAVIGGYILGTLVFGHVLENYGAILHQQRRDLAEARAKAQLAHTNGIGAAGGDGYKGAASDTDSEERLRIAIEGEGDCNCVHSA